MPKRFIVNESGATAIEYGLIASLIALVIIGVISNVGNKLSTTFNEVAATCTDFRRALCGHGAQAALAKPDPRSKIEDKPRINGFLRERTLSSTAERRQLIVRSVTLRRLALV